MLRPGDRIAVVAPASAFARVEFDAGVAELKSLGFNPVFEDSVFALTRPDLPQRARPPSQEPGAIRTSPG